MNDKALLNSVKKDIKAYDSNCNMLRELESKLDKAYYDLSGVKGLRYDKPKGNVDIITIKQRKQELSCLIELLETEISRVSTQIDYVDNILSNVEDEEIRQAVKDVYINNKQMREVALKFNYSHNTLKYWINKELLKAIKNILPVI